jgi:hypothetical protein
MLTAMMAGWISDQQQQAIEFHREVSRVLRVLLGSK